jgi:hypothetical protein
MGGKQQTSMMICSVILAVVAIAALVTHTLVSSPQGATVFPSSSSVAGTTTEADLLVLVAADETHHVARKGIQDLKYQVEASRGRIQMVAANRREQERAVEMTCPQALQRYQDLLAKQQEHLARELWKYCVLQQPAGPSRRLYVDVSSPLLVSLEDLTKATAQKSSLAVLGEDYLPRTIHGSLLLVQTSQRAVAAHMMSLLIETPIPDLALDSLLLPRTLYEMITSEADQTPLSLGHNGPWYLLEQVCQVDALRRLDDAPSSWTAPGESYRLSHACPQATGFCCAVRNGLETTVLLTRHPILPYQSIAPDIPRPYNAEAGHFSEEELPYLATIREQVMERPELARSTPNFFDILLANDCLPDGAACSKCLREKTGANCHSCAKLCPCYCRALCVEEPEKKFVAKQLTVIPPLYSRDPNRLVPRIIHQTYYEELTQEKYPNMSRLVESFKRSGWDYRFYSDEDAQNFLSTHFPAEVRQAYDALRPGAFKADLFRYCVLLIQGGVYADVDIMLEASLDQAIPENVGFVVPVDEPGMEANRRMCVWNGLIGAAPGHPILAQAIETVVNQVRNRFTSVDVDATFCPEPELSVLHSFDILFTAGPCLLGASINKVLGRSLQEPFVAGELIQNKGSDAELPGRTIILHQDKWDMGSHRFTFLEQNQVVAATDLEDSNDRNNQPSTGKTEHYSKTHKAIGIYGLEGLYRDKVQADEDIVFVVDAHAYRGAGMDAVDA